MKPAQAACAAALLAVASGRAHAAADDDARPYGRWTVEVGLAARARPDHIGARSYTADVWPVIEIQYGSRLHVSLDDGVKWKAVVAGPISFGPVAEYRQAFNDKLPPRTGKLSDAVELGGFAQADLGLGVLEARVRHAVTAYDGASADLAFDTGGDLAPKLSWGLEARSSWADRDYTRLLVRGRRRAGAQPPVAEERTQDYVTAGGQFTGAYRVTDRVTFAVVGSEDRVLSGLSRRFAATRDLFGLSTVLTYRFGRRPSPGIG